MLSIQAVLLLTAGVLCGFGFRALFVRLLTLKTRRDVARLNNGEYGPLLSGYADEAVLRFAEGNHRWAGIHRGRPAIERFLRQFVDAGLRGRVREVWVNGPLWALRLVVRFDDEAFGSDGVLMYSNRTVLVAQSRWGRIVEQEDFFVDTRRIEEFEMELRRREGVNRISPEPERPTDRLGIEGEHGVPERHNRHR